MNRYGQRSLALLRTTLLLSLLAVHISIAMAIATQRPHATQFGQVDFNTYYAAALLFLQDRNMYDGDLTEALLRKRELAYIEDSNYIYPPYLAAVLSFGVSLQPLTFGLLWYLGNLIALALALWLILRGQSYQMREILRRWQYYLIFALLFAPTGHSLYVGQINAFLLLLFAAAFVALTRGREILSGLFLGAATLIKVAPCILAAHLLVTRRFAALTAMFLAVIGIPAGTFPIFKDQLAFYFSTVPARLSNPMAHPVNQSLNGFFSRLFTENAFTVPIHAGSPTMIRTLVLITGLAIVGVVVSKFTSSAGIRAARNADLSLGILITLIVILSPLAWENLYLILLFPYLAVFHRWRLLQRRFKVLLVSSVLFVQGQRLWDPFTNAPLEYPLLQYLSPLMSLGLYGALMLIYIQLGLLASGEGSFPLLTPAKKGLPRNRRSPTSAPSPGVIRDPSRKARGGSRRRPPGPPPPGRSTVPAAGGR